MSLTSLLMGGKYTEMTSYFSMAFLAVFLPLTLILFSVVPKKAKKYVLLIVSWGFFWLISGNLLIYLILSILSVHYFGIWLDRIAAQRDIAVKASEKEGRKAVKKAYRNKQRWVIALAALLHIGTLLVLKYSPFFTTNINSLLCALHIPLCLEIPKFLMPIGISFFTMQAMSYIFDVYHGVCKADGNVCRLALFMSFFPQIVEGPICRYNETANALWNVEPIKYENLTMGIQRIIFGLMKKMVVADRLNPLIQTVFNDYSQYGGFTVALGAVAYTIQLYMDFSGTMDGVIGTAQIFGVKLPENFQRPFFSKTISEFWKRWHITLGAWFKDYIFYPVTMSKPMKNLTTASRKKLGNHFGPLVAGSIALFCVWFSNGLWHGAAWSYIFFGMYHFALILMGSIIEPLVKWVNGKLHIKNEWFVYRALQIVRTTVLVIIGEMFFRANGLRAGFAMFKKLVSSFSFSEAGASGYLKSLGVDVQDLVIVGVTVVIIFVISLLNEKGIQIRESLQKKPVAVRWLVIYALIMFIVIFGAYGKGYVPVDPIYANF